ncbi:MAG: beta-ketoacyl-ACP synthase III [Blautia sp.]|jgi:3-oxoacyl-[acyl-carrier-protein] synthase-3
MTTRIMGTGSALPHRVLTNEDMSKLVETNDEWISSRTGIKERRLAGQGEDSVTLAVQAGRQALEDAGVSPEEIDLLIVATCSSESYFPSVGCQVQAALGLSHCAAFDISAACSGFLFALHTAHAYIQAGIYQKALLIGAETLSRIIDWKDRSTCVLFGDGAGACVVQAEETGLVDFIQASDGRLGHVLTAEASTLQTPAAKEGKPMKPLAMDGQAVFRFAVKTVPECISRLLERTGTAAEDVKYYVLHQANMRIIQSVAKRLGLSEEKFPMNLASHGNTSAASIPILLDELNRGGRLSRGDFLVLSGFGAGLTWGAALLEW